MKFAGAKAEAMAAKPLPQVVAWLVFCPDPGLAQDIGARLADSLRDPADPFADVRMTEDDLKRGDMALLHAMTNRSLLGGRGVVRLRIENEASSQRIQKNLNALLAEGGQAANPLVIEAGELRKTSKLRVFFEEAELFAALQLYEPDPAQFAEFVRNIAAEKGLLLSEGALAEFVARIPVDRNLARAEIEKLCLYWYGETGPVTEEAVVELCAPAGGEDYDDSLHAAFAGDAMGALTGLTRSLEAGAAPVSITRAAQRRLLRLLAVREAMAGGRGLDQAIAGLRPPIFARARTAFESELALWPLDSLQALAPALYGLEIAMKRKDAPAAEMLGDLALRIARSAEARRNRRK